MRKQHIARRNDSFSKFAGIIKITIPESIRRIQITGFVIDQPEQHHVADISMSILLLAGSPTSPSRSTRLLQFIGDQLALHDHPVHAVHVRALPAEALLHADFNDVQIRAARARVADAAAIVIGTPVYKASYSGVLKAFLDLLPQDGLQGKVILPLATGGSQSHMLALDYALRPVLAALGAELVLPSIYATDSQLAWSAESGLAIDLAIRARIDAGVEQLAACMPSAQASLLHGAGFIAPAFPLPRCSSPA
jgi:FMN reductase